MNRTGLQMADAFLFSVIGPVLYLIVWLLVLPPLADLSTRLAVVLLALFTGAYCYAIASSKGLRRTLWGTVGLLAGLLEIGILPVLAVGLIKSGREEAGSESEASPGPPDHGEVGTP